MSDDLWQRVGRRRCMNCPDTERYEYDDFCTAYVSSGGD